MMKKRNTQKIKNLFISVGTLFVFLFLLFLGEVFPEKILVVVILVGAFPLIVLYVLTCRKNLRKERKTNIILLGKARGKARAKARRKALLKARYLSIYESMAVYFYRKNKKITGLITQIEAYSINLEETENMDEKKLLDFLSRKIINHKEKLINYDIGILVLNPETGKLILLMFSNALSHLKEFREEKHIQTLFLILKEKIENYKDGTLEYYNETLIIQHIVFYYMFPTGETDPFFHNFS